MSTATATTTPAPTAAPARPADGGPSLVRLIRVELRKMTDTRAGFWLLVSTFAIAILVLVAMLIWAPDDEQTLDNFGEAAIGLPGLLLPVLGILLITSEWSQRTALTTFALVPRRTRVVLAKAIAAVLLAVGASLIYLQLGVLANLLTSGDGDWNFTFPEIGAAILFQVLGILGGFAIGLALLRSAPAIVLAFLLPTVFAVLAQTIPGFSDTAEWLDTTVPTADLGEDVGDGTAWAKLATSWGLWLGVPLAIGLWRVRRAEVS